MKNKIVPVLRYKPSILAAIAAAIIIGALSCNNNSQVAKENSMAQQPDTSVFTPPDTSKIPHDQFGEMVRYGRELLLNTAYYLGPNGTVGHYLGNKMTCSNCHVEAGTRPYAFNFFSTHARYPQYRGRENEVLNLGQRINNCVERPGNGTPLPIGSKEIVAMECYMKWLSAKVPVGGHAKGDEPMEIENFPDRAADVKKGAAIYAAECTSCHGVNGEGKLTADSVSYLYPPLWGPNSFQNGSSPSRVVKMAEFIKANMPDKKATWQKPYLTDEQAIDVAAFINDGTIHPRPQKRNQNVPDYPNIAAKAIDYEMGPYNDTFSAFQHKFGPYKPIRDYRMAHNQPVIW
jgi:thiosulfate dehydrogenase